MLWEGTLQSNKVGITWDLAAVDIEEIRRRTLDRLVMEHWGGTRATLSAAINRPASFLGRYYQDGKWRVPITSGMARRLELVTRNTHCPELALDWLDNINNVPGIASVPLLSASQAMLVLCTNQALDNITPTHHAFVPPVIERHNLFAYQVTDDAMQSATDEQSIPVGYTVIVRLAEQLSNIGIALLALENKAEPVLRTVVADGDLDGEPCVQLRALSPHYRTMHVAPDALLGQARLLYAYRQFSS